MKKAVLGLGLVALVAVVGVLAFMGYSSSAG